MRYLILLFLFSSCVERGAEFRVKVEAKKEKIILLAFLNNSNSTLQSYLSKEVSTFYRCKVEINTTLNLPKEAYYHPRNRYKADSLLEFLKAIEGYDKIIGLTDKDISTTKGNIPDHGVFGLGYCPGKSCVASNYRLGKSNIKYLTVILHEIGHTYGLPHCPNTECLMTDAKGKMIKTRIKPYMCDICRDKINLVIQIK